MINRKNTKEVKVGNVIIGGKPKDIKYGNNK